MSDYPMLISNKLHSFRNFRVQKYGNLSNKHKIISLFTLRFKILAITSKNTAGHFN